MKRRALIAAALAVAVAASLAATAGAGSRAVARSEAVSCKGTIKIGILTVLSGPAAFLGQDQKSWAVLAAKRVAPQLGLKAKIVDFDTTLDPAVALTAAQKVVGDRAFSPSMGLRRPAESWRPARCSPTQRSFT